jgi:hypothetical protein
MSRDYRALSKSIDDSVEKVRLVPDSSRRKPKIASTRFARERELAGMLLSYPLP